MAELPEVMSALEDVRHPLSRARMDIEMCDDYYRGQPPNPALDDTELQYAYSRFLDQSRSNFMRIVVDSVSERLGVKGFRLSPSESADADEDAWMIWQRSQMDSKAKTGFQTALVAGRAYWSVAEDDEGRASIALEDPRNTWVEHSSSTDRKRLWAVRQWKSGKLEYARFWDEETTWLLVRDADGGKWQVDIEGTSENTLGVVPVVPMYNRYSLFSPTGESEIADVLKVQDRINVTLFYRMLAEHFVAAPMKYATGFAPDVDEDGNVVEPWNVFFDKMIWSADSETRFGSFPQGQITPYVEAIEQDVLHIAVQTRTPRHYLIEQGQSPSGDAMKSAETGLVAKVRDKQKHYGEALEEVMRLARLVEANEDTPPDSEVIWEDPEYRTEGELVDALLKMKTLGVPNEFLWERWGMTPQEIARNRAASIADMVLSDLGSREVPDPGVDDADGAVA